MKTFLRFAALGAFVGSVSSAQSLSWAQRNLEIPSGTNLTGAAYGNGKYVVLADSRAATSSDVSAWNIQSLPAGARTQHLTFGHGLFVATGGSTTSAPSLWTSPDGTTWTTRTTGTGRLNAAAASATLFIAVGDNVEGQNAVTSPDGIAWTRRTIGDRATQLAGLVYHPVRDAFVAWENAALWISTDGVAWTRRTLPNAVRIVAVTTGGDTLLAAATTTSSSNGVQLYSSTDGVDWQPVGVPSTNTTLAISSLAASDTVTTGRGSVVLGTSAQLGRYISPPGGGLSIFINYSVPSTVTSAGSLLSWRSNEFGSTSETALNASMRFVVYANGLFLAGTSDGRLYTATPAPAIIQQSEPVQNVASGEGVALSVATAGPGLTYRWTFNGVALAGATSATYPIERATFAHSGTYVATVINASGSSTTSTPIDLVVTAGNAPIVAPAWTERNVGGAAGAYTSVAYGAGRYVALSFASGAERAAVSADAVTWTSHPLPDGARGRVSFLNGQFVICADNSSGEQNLFTSPDGAVWTPRNTGDGGLLDVAYANGRYVAVGSGRNGKNCAISTDGSTWTRGAIGNGQFDVGRIVAHPTLGIFVATSGSETLWTTTDGLAWTAVALPLASSNRGVAALVFDGESFVALVQTSFSVFQFFSSPDGRVWRAGAIVPTPSGFNVSGLASTSRSSGGSTPVIVTGTASGSAYALVSSADLTSWRITPLGTASRPSVTVQANGFVFLGLDTRLLAAPLPIAYLSNLSVLARAGTSSETLTAGVTVGGGAGTKPILIRGIGPTLRSFGIDTALADPILSVLRAGVTLLAANDDWIEDAAIVATSNAVGAFALPTASKDAAINGSSFPAGGYVIELAGKAGATGTALIEVYDTERNTVVYANSPRLTNLAARTFGGTGASTLTAGFTVAGSGSLRVLLRASGPALAPFGVVGLMPDPKLELFKGTTKLGENDNWAAATLAAQNSAGAFSFPSGSRDSVLVATLEPGSYTAQVTAVGGATGVALVEVYELP